MSDSTRQLDAAGVIDQCLAVFIPVNILPGIAIAAHRQKPTPFTLRAVILACTPNVDDCRAQMDYLAALPDREWKEASTDWHLTREQVLDGIRRSIAWRTVFV